MSRQPLEERQAVYDEALKAGILEVALMAEPDDDVVKAWIDGDELHEEVVGRRRGVRVLRPGDPDHPAEQVRRTDG